MPLYEYKCNKCDEVFEVLQRFSDAPVKVHEICGGKVHRLLTAPTFKFKGSGFYTTDYRSDSYKEAAKSDSGPAKTDAAVKSDAAPAKVNGKSDTGVKSPPAKTAPAPVKAESKSAAQPVK